MHLSFVPYGMREHVEKLLRQMECQKFNMPMHNDKGETRFLLGLECQVRQLPFGIYDFIFPKEYLDLVLATLTRGCHDDYVPDSIKFMGMQFSILPLLQKLTHTHDYPKEFSTEKVLPWIRDFVNVFVIGIKEDGEITGTGVIDNGWKHEAI